MPWLTEAELNLTPKLGTVLLTALETGIHVHSHNQATLSFTKPSALQCDFGDTDILAMTFTLYLRAPPFFILYLRALPSFKVLESPRLEEN